MKILFNFNKIERFEVGVVETGVKKFNRFGQGGSGRKPRGQLELTNYWLTRKTISLTARFERK